MFNLKLQHIIKKFCNIRTPLFCTTNSMKANTAAVSSYEAGSTDIVWMDLEMTGLDVLHDNIIEVSCLITDKNLNIKTTGPCFAINYPIEVFENMNAWCMKQHYESGLVQKCLESKITIDEAEAEILDFLKQQIPKRMCPLAGNSIYMDRLFLRKCMPTVDEYLHYRIIDVSTIKTLCGLWNSAVASSAPAKTFSHRSLKDIQESIDELKFYREHFLRCNIS